MIPKNNISNGEPYEEEKEINNFQTNPHVDFKDPTFMMQL